MTGILPASFGALADSLQRVKDFTAASGASQYLKYTKIGEWVLGRDETPVEDDSEWVLNPHSIKTGYSAFDNSGNRTGEEMRPLAQPPVTEAELPPVVGTWGRQISFEVKCTTGEDEGTQATISFRSRGGLEAASNLVTQVIQRVSQNLETCCPVVTLDKDRYKHSNPSYGYVYIPVFDVVNWVTLDGPAASEPEVLAAPEPEPETEPEEAPRRRPRRTRK